MPPCGTGGRARSVTFGLASAAADSFHAAMSPEAQPSPAPSSLGQRWLNRIERAGNKLPDPAAIFLLALALTWLLSALLAQVQFKELDPRTIQRDAAGAITAGQPIAVKNLLTSVELTKFLERMVRNFTSFPPLGVVLVALMGVAVAERAGFITAGMKYLLQVTPRFLLTPMIVLVGIISHAAGDTGFVLVIPLGGVMFAAAGRHPLAGLAAAFAGVAGGFSACFVPSALDPLLQGFTQAAAQLVEPGRQVNPLCNWYVMSASCVLITLVSWYLTDRQVEPRLQARVTVDLAQTGHDQLAEFPAAERRGFWAGMGVFAFLCLWLAWFCWPADSPMRSPKDASLTGPAAPLMECLVPLLAIFFLVPGTVHGLVAGTVRSHRELIQGVAGSLGSMGYYFVIVFCASQFTYVFRESNLGALLAVEGASALRTLHLPGTVTVLGMIALSATVNLFIGSASAKWALLAPVLVPLLMQLGISPEMTQAAYRIGDSTTNVITPLMAFFPLVLTFFQRYSSTAGTGTVISTMMPYTVCLLVGWSALLIGWWWLGLPLGVGA